MSYSFQKEYTLKAQTPLIHFQSDMQGATLRATEVKPKLDRYIINCYKSENNGRNVPEEWCLKKAENSDDKNVALNYKMSIQRIGTDISLIPLGRNTDYDIFYGNTGVSDESKEKQGIKADCKLTIICFNKNLFDYIKSKITDFFFVTNFGTMQSKGFGSFIVGSPKFNHQGICQLLKEKYSATHCYYFTVKNNCDIFKAIKCIYSLMKSGVNYGSYRHSILFDYMHDSEKMGSLNLINNEKAWLKQQKIAPNIGTHRLNCDRTDSNSKYVRALFGISDSMSFKEKVNGDNNFVVNRKETSGVIERLPSPVLFKVIGKTVYYVGMPINEEIYGKTFNFSSEWEKDGKEIVVPKKEELPDDFINDFMHYAYIKIGKCRQNFREIKNIQIQEG